jgi:hypothetical protein
MTLNEAIDYLQKEGHGPEEARRQLFNALGDNALSFRCADARDEATFGSCPTSWYGAIFRPDNGGEVFCDKGMTDYGKELRGAELFRPILVSRRKVMELWTARAPNVVSIRLSTRPGDRDKGGRPSSLSEVAAILDKLLDLDATLLSRIDEKAHFKSIAWQIRSEAGKTEAPEGWPEGYSDSALRSHIKSWRSSKDKRTDV